MKKVEEICSYANQILDVYEKTKNLQIRNDLYHQVISPVLDLAYYVAAHWEVDGKLVDLMIDDLPANSGDPDVLAEKITPEMALEYIKANRCHCVVAARFEYIENHPIQKVEPEGESSAIDALKSHIDVMKEKLDVASALLDISSIGMRVDDLAEINEKMMGIVRGIYKNIVSDENVEPTTEEESAPVESDDELIPPDPVEPETEPEPALFEEEDDGFASIDETGAVELEPTSSEPDPADEPEQGYDPMMPPEETTESEPAPIAEPEPVGEVQSAEEYIAQHVVVDGGVPLSDGSSITIN